MAFLDLAGYQRLCGKIKSFFNGKIISTSEALQANTASGNVVDALVVKNELNTINSNLDATAEILAGSIGNPNILISRIGKIRIISISIAVNAGGFQLPNSDIPRGNAIGNSTSDNICYYINGTGSLYCYNKQTKQNTSDLHQGEIVYIANV